MSPQRITQSNQPVPVRLEPGAELKVKLVEPATKPFLPAIWMQRIRKYGVVFAILLGMLSIYLWGTYVLPRTEPLMRQAAPISVVLIRPYYVTFGDEATLELTVSNPNSVPITGTVTAVFSDTIRVRPLPTETTTIKFENLASGASMTQYLNFSMPKDWIFFSHESVRFALQATLDDKLVGSANDEIAIAPFPYIATLASPLSVTTILGALFGLGLDFIKKRLLGL